MVKATAACLHGVLLATKTMVKATAACLHRVLLAPKLWCLQRPLAFTVCFWHQNHGEGNGRLPSPCVFGTKTMVKATAACLHRVLLVTKTMVKATAPCLHRVLSCWHQNHGEGNGHLPSPCVIGTKTMVKATAACLHRVLFWHQNHGEGNGRLPSPCAFGHQNHGEGNGRLPSPCVFGTKTIVQAEAACLHGVLLCCWAPNHGEGNGRLP